MNPKEDVRIVLADKMHRSALGDLVSRIEAEEHPDDANEAALAQPAMRQSLSHYNFLNSDCVWVLLALADEAPVGLAVLVRIPKLDHRLGFLYLDELHVVAEWRRHGIAAALLQRARSLTREQGLAGIRLLARPDNQPARTLYESLGFRGSETMLYHLRLDRETP